MGREWTPAKQSMRVVMYYSYHLMGAVAVLCILDHVLGIASEIYLRGHVSKINVFPLVEFLKEKDSTLVLVLWIFLGVYLGGYVSPLIGCRNEKKRTQIAGQDINDCPVIDGESSHRTESQAGVWFMDSGAQCHATGDIRLFSGVMKWVKQGSWIYGVSGHEHPLPIRGIGTVQFPDFKLEEVYYVDGLDGNLICVKKLMETFGYSIMFGKAAYIQEEATGKRICEIRTRNSFYELDSVAVPLDRTRVATEGRA